MRVTKFDMARQIVAALHNLLELPNRNNPHVKRLMRRPITHLELDYMWANKILLNRNTSP